MGMSYSFGILSLIQLALILSAGFALIDAIIRPAQAFVAADKLTKVAWLWLTGLALVCLLLFPLPGLLSLIAVVASSVYLVDVRPAVASVTRRRP